MPHTDLPEMCIRMFYGRINETGENDRELELKADLRAQNLVVYSGTTQQTLVRLRRAM